MGYKDACEECQWMEECIRKMSIKYDSDAQKWKKTDEKCIKLKLSGKGGIIWQD